MLAVVYAHHIYYLYDFHTFPPLSPHGTSPPVVPDQAGAAHPAVQAVAGGAAQVHAGRAARAPRLRGGAGRGRAGADIVLGDQRGERHGLWACRQRPPVDGLPSIESLCQHACRPSTVIPFFVMWLLL